LHLIDAVPTVLGPGVQAPAGRESRTGRRQSQPVDCGGRRGVRESPPAGGDERPV